MMVGVTARLFVAIWPDDASRDALATTVHEARSTAAAVRWQPPERWHITLAFLGHADPEQAVSRISTHNLLAPEPIHLARSGTFGPVIWVGVEHGRWLAEVAGGLQRTLRVADRRFRAHVTVGRVRGPGGPAQARDVAARLSAHVGPAWTPAEVTLIESTTGPAPEYRVRERWPLGSSGTAPRASPRNLDRPGRAMRDSSAPEILEEP